MSKKDKIQHKKVKGTEMVYRSFSLPASLIEDLKLLKDSYEETWKEDEGVKERVTYEKIFERLLSKSGLGHVDPDVYEEFVKAKETRKEFPAVVTRATRGAVGEIFRRMQSNGTSLIEEALKEQEEAKAALAEDLRASAGDSPAPAEDQVQSPEPVATPEVPADPTEGEVWLKGYYFERNGVRIDALVGTKGAAFYCKFNDRDTGIGPMLYDHHFRFYNSDGTELSKEQAEKISSRIKAHDQFEADH